MLEHCGVLSETCDFVVPVKVLRVYPLMTINKQNEQNFLNSITMEPLLPDSSSSRWTRDILSLNRNKYHAINVLDQRRKRKSRESSVYRCFVTSQLRLETSFFRLVDLYLLKRTVEMNFLVNLNTVAVGEACSGWQKKKEERGRRERVAMASSSKPWRS